jgi:outer membrane protein assembly factor BamB
MSKKIMIKLDALSIAVAMAVCVCSFAFVSCGDDEKEGGKVEYDPSKPVVLTSFHPDSGGIASKMIFDGDNFGSDPDKIKVYFNQKPAPVIGSSGKRMYAVVPRLPGDTCTVSVVVGNDSVVYDKKFRYKISVTVSTIAGNGQNVLTGGSLDQALLRPSYLCVDNENNIFVAMDRNPVGLARVNEEENSMTVLYESTVAAGFAPTAPCVDPKTGLVTICADNELGQFCTMDPKEGWAPRIRSWIWKEGTAKPTNGWKKCMAACEVDGYVYVSHYNGHVVKIDPKTWIGETIAIVAQGDNYIAFNPLHPNMLYFTFVSNAGVNANGIYTMDVTAPYPDSTFTRLNINAPTAPGHRDGEVATAQFSDPRQLFFDPEGNLYIADGNNHCIRKITTDNMVETVVGVPGERGYSDGGKDEARFDGPWGIGVSRDGTVYVADCNNCRLRKLAIE